MGQRTDQEAASGAEKRLEITEHFMYCDISMFADGSRFVQEIGQWFLDLESQAKTKHGPAAYLTIVYDGVYDGYSSADFMVVRPETDAEMTTRLEKLKVSREKERISRDKAKKDKEEAERNLYLKLKKKYENG